MKDLYIRESYLKKIRGFYNDTDMIKVVTGIRRCGKSSLLEMINNELINNYKVNENNILYIHLDRKPYNKIKKDFELEHIIDNYFKNLSGIKYLFIDEIQNIDNFEELINSYREESEYSIFITGSNNYLLSGELVTKLTGRYIEFEMNTLSFDEYIGMKKYYNKYIDDDLDKEFIKYIYEGGFPLSIKYDDYDDKRKYVESVINEIFEKDIRKNKKIKKRDLFDIIQDYIINNFGSTMSITSLCKYLSTVTKTNVRKETVYNYLNILQDCKIVNKCSRFDMKSKKFINSGEKYYLSDLSFYFMRNTDNRINYGPVLENIIYNYVKYLGYSISVGRIGKLEVDFIVRYNFNEYSYIQVARIIDNDNYDDNGKNITEEREYRPFESISDGYSKYLLTLDKLLQKRSGVKHLNIIDCILNYNELK